jgi:hypothetical protein
MMVRRGLFASCVAAAVAIAMAPSARAQCRLCKSPTTTAEKVAADGSIQLDVEASLDFDRLIVLGHGGGSATLGPDGSRQVSGSVEALSARAMVGEARVRGQPGRAVRIDLPRRIDLYSASGGRIVIDEIATDLPSLPRLDASGGLTFRFGGRVRVAGDEEGDFRGDLPITAEYL